jgi:dUTP pyrophosphatase
MSITSENSSILKCSDGGCKISLRGWSKLSEKAIKPTRGTKGSAGYDISLPEDFEETTIQPGETVKVNFQVAAFMQLGEWVDLRIRSSMSDQLLLTNCCGVIDQDYYPRPIKGKFYNYSETPITLTPGLTLCQGIFTNHLLASDDEYLSEERVGGFGSTGAVRVNE